LTPAAAPPTPPPPPGRATEIWTDRLVLRPLGPGDLLAFHDLCTMPGVRRFLWDDHVLSVEEVRDLIAANVALHAAEGLGLWGARVRDDDRELCGFAGYWYFRDPPVLELVFAVAEPRWGRGFATEMAGGLVAYGFDALGLREIRASADAPNAGSLRVLEKVGFRRLEGGVPDAPGTVRFAHPGPGR
jgi:ribosomal-protein-alanine N-acetyltransferase